MTDKDIDEFRRAMSGTKPLEADERTRWIAIFLGSQRDAQHAVSSRRE